MQTISELLTIVGKHLGAESSKAHTPVLAIQAEAGCIARSFNSMERSEEGNAQYHLESIECSAAKLVLACIELCARHELDLDDAIQCMIRKRYSIPLENQ